MACFFKPGQSANPLPCFAPAKHGIPVGVFCLLPFDSSLFLLIWHMNDWFHMILAKIPGLINGLSHGLSHASLRDHPYGFQLDRPQKPKLAEH